MRLCLLQEDEINWLTPIRSGASDLVLRNLILEAVWEKPWGHKLHEDTIPINRSMGQIGG